MIEIAKKIRQIYNIWTESPIENFKAFKDKEIKDILDIIQPKNFDTPEKAFMICHRIWAKKLAYEELEEQKRIADDYDLKQAKNGK